MRTPPFSFPGTVTRIYGAAVGAVLLAAFLKMLLQPATPEQSPFLLFFAAVTFSAWYGGPQPGVLATFLAALSVDYFFMLPPQVVLRHNLGQNVQIFVFVLEGLLVTWLCTQLRGARQRAEASARENRDYRDRLRSKEATYQQHAEEMAEASRLKDEFLATVSHELRTPLNAILGWAQLCRGDKLDDAARAHALETIEQSAKIQARLIEDLLDISRIVTGKMRLDVGVVQLADVVEAAIETVRPAADAKEISVHTRMPSAAGSVFGDAKRLQQVAWNLISNAIKFTPRGGTVHVQLERHNSHVELTISDTGVGIKASFLPYVFDAFRQADSSSTRLHKGLGLGLDIVRRLVELHGGTVHAESAGEGQGATFRVRLPVAPRDAVSRDSTRSYGPSGRNMVEEAAPALRGLRVVLVDDDSSAREMLTAMLARCGVEVTAAASAAEGLVAVQRLKPHVLLSDIEMPEEDGYTLIRKVRELSPEQGGRTPALALTAYTRVEDRSRAFLAGFQMHLAKPVESEELIVAIATLAAQTRASR
jgi:signal transduction histidine kinase/CheY-like chemotaxis protein